MFLQINTLKKTYLQHGKPSTEALRGITLTIFQGEILALLGVNGAGKTTLSSILASLHPPTSGSILWQGRSLYANILAYRKKMGFCPQKPNVDRTFTLEENLIFAGRSYGMPLKDAQAHKEQLLEQFSLHPYAKSFVNALSGGYKQRFLLARALMHRPEFLILDEPTVGLDPQIRHQLWDIIKTLKQQGVTILLTTHYLEEAELLSDRVCIIDKGLIRLIDTPTQLKISYKKAHLEDVFLQLMQEEEK